MCGGWDLETRERVLFLQWLGACGEVFERERGDGSARSPLIVLRAGRAAASHSEVGELRSGRVAAAAASRQKREACVVSREGR